MKLSFRQGIARHQTDVNGNPTFLQRSASGQFIDLVVSPDQTTLVFAHRVGTYIVEETKTVQNAWGPLVGPGTKYLYWDVSLLSGALTRGITTLPPVYTSAPPVSPAVDQFWFDTVENVFRVWNGTKWVEKLRVFAGFVTSNAIVHAAAIGSEAGLNGDIEAGYIILDSFGSPLRQSNGTFVTSTSWLNVVNLGTTTVRLEEPVMSGMAGEDMPKYSLIQLRRGRRLMLARSTDYTSRVSGIITKDMYEGEVNSVVTVGIVQNDNWSFTDAQINRPLFCGQTGQVTLVPPPQGVLQQIGFVYDVNAIFMEIQPVIVLDNPSIVFNEPPLPLPIGLPIADFMMSPTSGNAPLTVSFTNSSADATALEWDFSNDGFVDDTTQNPTYTYSTPGVYTVRLRAKNSFGFRDMIKPNVISVSAPDRAAADVNLGLSFGAPSQITAGSTFSFQVITRNSGLSPATRVLRTIRLRSNNGTEVVLNEVPPGSVVTRVGSQTVVTLPLVDIASGGNVVSVLQATESANVNAIQLDGSVSSPEFDSAPNDNSASLTITVRS